MENNILNFLPIPVCFLDNDLKIKSIGDSFFGYSIKELMEKSISSILYNKEDYMNLRDYLSNPKDGTFQFLVITKEREALSKNIHISHRGNGDGYVCSFLDASDKYELQKKIQELEQSTGELKDSREALLNILEDIEEAKNLSELERNKTKAIIDNFPEGLLFFNRYDKLSSINSKIEEFFNIKMDDILKKTREDVSRVGLFREIEGILLDKIEGKEIEIQKGIFLEVSKVKIEKVGVLIIVRDITREKVIEKLKTEFVSIAAHQLRTPLSAIKWTLRMMLDGDVGDITEEQREFLNKTYKSNERMIYLINDLLNVTRIEEGRFLYKVIKKDLVQIIDSVISPIVDVAKTRSIDLVFNRPEEQLPNVFVDPEKIALVIQNFVDNAVNYTKPGGSIYVNIIHDKENKEIKLSVEDTGIGIPHEQQMRVFSKFFRSDNAVKSDTEGTGLGLYIAKNVIDAHNGKIWFESTIGQGSTFYFTLPIK